MNDFFIHGATRFTAGAATGNNNTKADENDRKQEKLFHIRLNCAANIII